MLLIIEKSMKIKKSQVWNYLAIAAFVLCMWMGDDEKAWPIAGLLLLNSIYHKIGENEPKV